MFSIMAPNQQRGWQNEGHNWKNDLARLCFMLYTPSYGNSQLKMEILEFTSKEAAAPLMSMAAPVWFWKFWEKNSEFGNFELKFPKSEANFDAERGIFIKTSKEEGPEHPMLNLEGEFWLEEVSRPVLLPKGRLVRPGLNLGLKES